MDAENRRKDIYSNSGRRRMKTAVERNLGRKISDTEYRRAMQDARRKQDFLSGLGYEHVNGEDYLLKLICEYVNQNAFSEFTMKVSRMLNNMEKEHSFQRTERPIDTPIVSVSAK